MKNLKTITIAVILLLVFGKAGASRRQDKTTFSKNYAINVYVDAMTRGKLNGFNDVLEPTVQFSVLQGKRIVSYNKKQMLDFLGSIKNIEEDCTTSTSLIEINERLNVVKVDMHFNGFVRSNYVTLVNNNGVWKIINVYSVFN